MKDLAAVARVEMIAFSYPVRHKSVPIEWIPWKRVYRYPIREVGHSLVSVDDQNNDGGGEADDTQGCGDNLPYPAT
jgi:hypothetical protein